MNRIYFENLVSLINDELSHNMYKEAFSDASLFPPCNLTSSLIDDFYNSTPHQVKLDLKAISDNEDNYVE